MIPQKLVMSAFGSFAGKEEIDFSKAGPGIFLVTGDTGAGKTTIFDAITYALYDQTSGGRRDGRMMRSQYAQDDTPTFVEFSFQYKGENYRIRRSPEYERASRRKGKNGERKMTVERSAVALFLPDGSEYTGKKAETNRKIIEIIGLDAGQFTQTVMIAQGDFLKLLSARSDERKEIFSRIFRTDQFSRIEQKIHDRAAALYGQMKDAEKAEEQEMARLFCPPEKELEEKLDAAVLPDERLDAVESLLSYGRLREEEAAKRLEDAAGELEQADRRLAVAEEINARFDRLEADMKEQASLQQQLPAMEEEKKRLERSSLARTVYEGCIRKEETAGQIRAMKEDMNTIQAQISQDAQTRETLKNSCGQAYLEEKKHKEEYGDITAGLQKLSGQLKSLSGSRELLQKCKEEEKKAEESLQKLAGLRKRLPLLKQTEEKKAQCLAQFEESKLFYQKEAEAYLACNEAFLQAQAGILASDLKEGEPCPVCGSLHHPSLAGLSAGAPDQLAVKEARKKRDQAEKEKDRCQQKLIEAGQACAVCAESLMAEGRALIGSTFILEEERTEQILKQAENEREDSLARCREQKNEAQNQVRLLLEKEEESRRLTGQQKAVYDAAEKAREKAVSIEQRIQQLSGQISQAEGQQKARRMELEKAGIRLQELSAAAQKALTEAGFADQEACRQSILEESQEEEINRKLDQYRRKCIETDTRIRTAKEQLAGRKPLDTAELKAEREKLARQRQTAEQQRREWYSKNEINRSAREHLVKIYGNFKRLQEQYARLRLLDQTAGGSLSGRAKIDLEAYVQRRYFQQIIQFANRRLDAMTGGSFVLKCRSMEMLGSRGNVGLDLDVYSLETGKIRDVRTLSGGESFMAALSMALGMGDVISRSAGGIQMKAMFVDEGFGSLDEYSREQAISVLNGLAGADRMIGIISHVTELKESIGRQLLVTKTKKGSHVRWNS